VREGLAENDPEKKKLNFKYFGMVNAESSTLLKLIFIFLLKSANT